MPAISVIPLTLSLSHRGRLIVSHMLGRGTQGFLGRLCLKAVEFKYRSTKFETKPNFKCSKFEIYNTKEHVWVI
jgi:hypothetical protein